MLLTVKKIFKGRRETKEQFSAEKFLNDTGKNSSCRRQ
jgi:hypothetical protein